MATSQMSRCQRFYRSRCVDLPCLGARATSPTLLSQERYCFTSSMGFQLSPHLSSQSRRNFKGSRQGSLFHSLLTVSLRQLSQSTKITEASESIGKMRLILRSLGWQVKHLGMPSPG